MNEHPAIDAGRRQAHRVLLAAACAALSGGARAQSDFPDRPLRFIVPQPPGGTGDVISRLVAQRLGARLGKPVVVENKAGAGGTLGASFVAKAAADGHTLLLASPGFATFGTMFPNLGFNIATDLAPVGMMGSVPVALVVRSESPFKSVADIVAHAKANPGKVTYASAGKGSLSHLLGALFRKEAGLDLNHIPYGGTAPAMNALVSGQVDIFFDPMSGSELIKAARLRALATTTETRSSMLPSVPTMREQGYAVTGSVWLGVMVTAGTPRPIIERLNRELEALLREPEIKLMMEARLVYPDPMGLEQFTQFFANETRLWTRLVVENGINADS